MLPKAWDASQLTWVALFQVCHPVGDTSRQFHRTAPLQIMAHRCALYLRTPRRRHGGLPEAEDLHASLCLIPSMKIRRRRGDHGTKEDGCQSVTVLASRQAPQNALRLRNRPLAPVGKPLAGEKACHDFEGLSAEEAGRDRFAHAPRGQSRELTPPEVSDIESPTTSRA